MIALICDGQEQRLTALLSEFDEVKLYPDGTILAYYLEDGGLCRLAVVAKDSAEGMNDCSYISGRKALGAVLWITEQQEFLNQSRRMGVTGFLVRPVSDQALREAVSQLLSPGITPPGNCKLCQKNAEDANDIVLEFTKW